MTSEPFRDEDMIAFGRAGRRAREDILTIDRLASAMRLAAFRSYLTDALRSMSVLVPDMLASGGTDVQAALQRMRPSRGWPGCAGLPDYAAASFRVRPRIRAFGGKTWSSTATRFDVDVLPLRVGDAVMIDGALADWVEVAVAGRCLDVTLRGDACALSTAAGMARIRIPGELPDTVAAAAVRRPLDDLLDHPLLRGRGFVARNVSCLSGETTVEFEVGLLPLETPWRD